jgi:hypothetical protein
MKIKRRILNRKVREAFTKEYIQPKEVGRPGLYSSEANPNVLSANRGCRSPLVHHHPQPYGLASTVRAVRLIFPQRILHTCDPRVMLSHLQFH